MGCWISLDIKAGPSCATTPLRKKHLHTFRSLLSFSLYFHCRVWEDVWCSVMPVNINEFGFLSAGSTAWALRWWPYLLQGNLDHQKKEGVEITGKEILSLWWRKLDRRWGRAQPCVDFRSSIWDRLAMFGMLVYCLLHTAYYTFQNT